ncbi:MAG: tRNA 2-thiouridine(34) synthase MnmA [Oscillospiraceae bacterium]|nr:tRNA 2-thiouridine(34) synthase MnmA [Oscillospiraceae bacterium]
MDKKALIAMSGGVDSSVAALLMKQAGFECMGVTMKLHVEELNAKDCSDKTCCTVFDAEDARSVCYRLGFPFYVFNYADEFRENVIDRFVRSYETGETPNPCIDCNRYLKFGRLYQKAAELGCEYVVTGHYARVEYDERTGRRLLKKSLNEAKDQSYVLYFLTQEQLAHTKFPLGEFVDKAAVRELAEKNGFINAKKGESQDICFVPDGDYAEFIRTYSGRDYPEGDFLDGSGNILGRHRGIIHYTIGQRKGLGISYSEPLYVCGKSVSDNAVILGTERELYTSELIACDFNWISLEKPPEEPIEVGVRTRYHAKEARALVFANSDGMVTVRFEQPQRAIAPGQAVVLYDGDTVVGGGRII